MKEICRLFNLPYLNTINNRLYNALRYSNVKLNKHEFDDLSDKDNNYIVNYFVKRQYKNIEEQNIVLKMINSKLYILESNNKININPTLTKYNFSKYNNIIKNNYSTISNSENRIINYYREKIYDNPYSLNDIKDIKLINKIIINNDNK